MIQDLTISYPDFVLNTIIDPEQFDTNNAEIVNKINELLNIIHSTSGAREIIADKIDGVSESVDLQSMLQAIKTYIDDNDNLIKADLINKYNEVKGLLTTNSNLISNLTLNKANKTDVYTKTESDTKFTTKVDSDNKLSTHKISADHDSRYYTKDELATNILKITNPGININIKDYSTIALTGQTIFILPSGVFSRITDLLEVFYNGTKLTVNVNYKINSDTQIELIGWSAESGAEIVLQVQTKVWNTQDLVSGRQLQDGTIDLVKLNTETQNKINEIETIKTSVQNYDTQLSEKAAETDNTRLTTSKTVTGAINELFTNANNGKQYWVDVIGSPLLNTDTFSILKTKTQTLKDTMATNLTSKGQSSLGTEELATLINKIPNINTGKKFANLVVTVPNQPSSDYTDCAGNKIIGLYSAEVTGLDFTPSTIMLIMQTATGNIAYVTQYFPLDLYNGVPNSKIIMSLSYYDGTSPMSKPMKLQTPAYVQNGSFKLPVKNYGDYVCYCYE